MAAVEIGQALGTTVMSHGIVLGLVLKGQGAVMVVQAVAGGVAAVGIGRALGEPMSHITAMGLVLKGQGAAMVVQAAAGGVAVVGIGLGVSVRSAASLL